VGARDKDELLAGLSKILADEAVVVFQEELITLAEGGQWFESEEVHRTLSGEERFIVLNLSVAPGYANSLGKVLVSVLDITERKRAEEALHRSEDKFAKAFRTSPDAINIHRMCDGQYLEINDGFTAMTGYTSAEVIGKTSLEINIWADPQDRARLGQALREHGEVIGLEAEFRTKGGSIRTGLISARLIDMSGEPCILSITRDITDRKRIEEALRENEARYRAVIESQVDLISRYLPDTTLTFVNDAYCQFYGKTREELIGHSYLFMIAPEFRELVRKETEDLSKDPRPLAGEYLNYRHDGKECWIQWVVQCISDENGQVVEIQAVGRDITERKRAEQALRESEERYRLLAEAAHDMIYIINREGNVDYANSFATQQFGRLPGEIIGRPHAELFLSDDAERQQVGLRQVFEAGQPLYVENLTRFPNRGIWLGTWLVPIKDEAGQVKSVLGVSRDITKRKQAEEEIQRLNAELEQRVIERTAQLETANKELEAFSYSVSHDLRAPLRALDGFSRILLEDYAPQLPPEVARYLRIIFENTQQMGRLIDDLLAFSRSSRQPLNKQPVAPTDLARQALQSLSGEQVGRRIEISIGELPACQGDPALLRQVWINLLSNALKFTRERNVARIEIGCLTQEDGAPVYFVKDNGVGFDIQYAGKLFGVFQRLHRSEDYEGTGVGLAIVQRIIHRHGGRVWAEAEVNKGATFYFTI